MSMPHHAASFALIALLGACASEARDPIIDRALHLPLGQTQELEAWLTAHPEGSAETRIEVLSQLCDAHSRVGRYRAAADACAAAADLNSAQEQSTGMTQAIAFWRALAGEPPISVSGQIDQPLSFGWSGMGEIPVMVGAQTIGFGIDTGAEVSLLRASDAERLRVRLLDEGVSITGSTPGVASGRLGMIDHMRIGDAEIEHVPVFVLPDEMLTFEGHVLPPVLGMPVLFAFGAFEFSEHGARLRTQTSLEPAPQGDILWNATGIAITLHLARGPVQVHLDTGANATELSQHTLALLSPTERQTVHRRQATIAGVSGTVERRISETANITVTVGEAECTLPLLSFGEEEADAEGRAGMDLVRACDRLMLDFNTMRFNAR